MKPEEFEKFLLQAEQKRPALKETLDKMRVMAAEAAYHPMVLKTMTKSVNKSIEARNHEGTSDLAQSVNWTENFIERLKRFLNFLKHF